MGEFLRAEQESRRRSIDLERDLWAKFGLNGFCFSETVRDARSCETGKLEGFHEAGAKALVTATVVCPSFDLTRARFTLVQPKGEWRVSGVAYFCRLCAGTGSVASPISPQSAKLCSICQGLGYFVPARLKKAQDNRAESSQHLRSAKADLDQFMHQYLAAERALVSRQLELAGEMWASFAVPQFRIPRLSALKRRWDDQTMVHTFRETSDGAVVIVMVVRTWQTEGRVRYTVVLRDGTWWIIRFDHACRVCNGTGSHMVMKDSATSQMVCMACHGKSWFPADGPETSLQKSE